MVINQFTSALSNVPSLTKAMIAGTMVMSTSAYIYIFRLSMETEPDFWPAKVCPLIGIVPGVFLYTPWTLLTAIFYESNLISLIGSIILLVLCGKYLERAWGSQELLKFVVITGVVTNLITLISLMLTFYINRKETLLYSSQITGMMGVFSGFLVAFKHLIPEHRLAILGGSVSIRVKNLVGVATAISIVALLFFKAFVFYNFVNIGWIVGWVYIRFFKVQDGIQGDQSEAFAFLTFFPERVHPLVGPITNVVYKVCLRLHLCPSPQGRHISYQLEEGTTGVKSGSVRQDLERRRALALKALDKRLDSMSKKTSTSNPSSSSASSSTAAATSSTVLFDGEKETKPAASSTTTSAASAAPQPSDNTISVGIEQPNEAQDETSEISTETKNL